MSIDSADTSVATGSLYEGEVRAHIVAELGMTLRRDADALHGRADVNPFMLVPGTQALRTSVLAAWSDWIAGISVGLLIGPRVPVTLDLSIDTYRPAVGVTGVHGVGRILKAGRSVLVVAVDFSDQDGVPLAASTVSFMPSPDASLVLPSMEEGIKFHDGRRYPPMVMPYADRANCRRTSTGVAELPRSEDGLNASNTINGGLSALVAEEAVLSANPGATLSQLAIRYLRAARVGPIIATSTQHGDVARVEIRDAGSDDRLTVSGVARVRPPS